LREQPPAASTADRRKPQTAPETVNTRPQIRRARRCVEMIEQNSMTRSRCSSVRPLATRGLPVTAPTRLDDRKCGAMAFNRPGCATVSPSISTDRRTRAEISPGKQ
jgi:hypothetical protein